MNYLLDKIKEYINDVAYNVKNVFSLKDDLDKIIEKEYKKAFESLHKYGIIEYIENRYKINYKKPKLEILEYVPSLIGGYSQSKNEITFSKKSIERLIDEQLKFLGYKEIKRSISNIQGIKYLNKSYNSTFLYPVYINEKNIRESIAESIIRSTMFHERWHSIDYSILNKLDKDSTIKDRDYLLTILNNRDNLELRATAFEVPMYYLVSGLHEHEKGYIAAYRNMPICREFIDKLEKKNIYTYVHYDLGYCYGNIIVAAYKSSLEKNIYNIIEDIVHLDEKKAIDVIKHYVYNPDKLLHD